MIIYADQRFVGHYVSIELKEDRGKCRTNMCVGVRMEVSCYSMGRISSFTIYYISPSRTTEETWDLYRDYVDKNKSYVSFKTWFLRSQEQVWKAAVTPSPFMTSMYLIYTICRRQFKSIRTKREHDSVSRTSKWATIYAKCQNLGQQIKTRTRIGVATKNETICYIVILGTWGASWKKEDAYDTTGCVKRPY